MAGSEIEPLASLCPLTTVPDFPFLFPYVSCDKTCGVLLDHMAMQLSRCTESRIWCKTIQGVKNAAKNLCWALSSAKPALLPEIGYVGEVDTMLFTCPPNLDVSIIYSWHVACIAKYRKRERERWRLGGKVCESGLRGRQIITLTESTESGSRFDWFLKHIPRASGCNQDRKIN